MNGPAIYVGTYAKYAAGSIKGAWLQLEQYADLEEFLEACKQLHKDETDPELMFQDYQDFPSAFYNESHIKPELWDWLELDEYDRELLAAYQDAHCSECTDIQQARETFVGVYKDPEDFAQTYAEEIGAVSDDAKWPYTCIDWEHAARELLWDFSSTRHNGQLYVFHN